MTEIDVTTLAAEDHKLYSASAFELGEDAARVTWQNALERAEKAPLAAPDQLDDVRAWLDEFGAWDDLEDWPDLEVQALLVQFVAGRFRETDEAADLYQADDGRWYFLVA